MALLQKLILGFVVIFLILVALIFSINNQVSVALDFIFFETPAYGVAFWLILAFVAGGIIGVLLTSIPMLRGSVRRKNLQRKLDHAEKARDQARLETGRTP
jgi:uncharacterized membrane protein YciS (DUF1049 family)